MLDYPMLHDYLAREVMEPFYQRRFDDLTKRNLDDILTRKNPYLFKAKNMEIAADLVKSALDAFLSSQEETIFGNLLEGFAIYISGLLYGGFKSSFKSIDLEFERKGVYYIVGIKSGPNWGNSDQISRMKDNFKAAKQTLRERGIFNSIVSVNGCIYGKDRNPFKQDRNDSEKNYYKYCGQEFWEFISGDANLYQEIIKPIDEEAKQKDENFKRAYTQKLNEMTTVFSNRFLTNNQIDWVKLIDFVSKKESGVSG